MHVDQAGVCLVLVTPNLFEQHFARENLLWHFGQRLQQAELERGKRDALTVATNFVTGNVDNQWADAKFGDTLGNRNGAKARLDSGENLVGVIRLGDVVVCTRVEAA